MSCIDHDYRARVSQWVLHRRIPGLTNDMVYHADDTIVFLPTIGCWFESEVNIRHAMLNATQGVRKTLFKWLRHWKALIVRTKWQLIIFDAVVRSKLLYSLGTVHLTNAMLKKWMLSADGFSLLSIERTQRQQFCKEPRQWHTHMVLNALAGLNRIGCITRKYCHFLQLQGK